MLGSAAIILLALMQMASTLSLEGNWLLTSLQSSPVSVAASIEEFIFEDSEIMKRVTFKTCNSLQYDVSIDSDSFWIDIDS